MESNWSTLIPAGLIGIPSLAAIVFYLWKVQRSVISPMDNRLRELERVTAYERQERQVCDWRFSRLVRWRQDHDDDLIPDAILYERPSWATIPDPLEDTG
jgi:hypothetical protein